MASCSILVVDDEPGVRAALAGILADEGFTVRTVESGEAALELLARDSFDTVLLDVWLPGIDGLETLERLRERGSDAEVVMISGHGTIETAVKATKLGAFDFIEKPLSLEKTLLVLRNALRQRRLERSNRHLLEQLVRDAEILGTSPAAERLRGAVRAAAGSDASVLLCGEQGSGRETVARHIHRASRRPDDPFVELPCGALDAAAAERALFGAGATAGRLELASGGTLFLEDAERLAPELQQRLAAFLVDAATRRPGVRVLASTGVAVAGLGAELRQCIEVLRIDVPALRERREDIPVLAERFLHDLAREYGRPPKRLAPAAVGALTAWSWPGNLRELRNLVERLILLAPSETIEVRDLPAELGGASVESDDLYRDFGTLAEGLRAFERSYVRRALAAEQGSDAAAARRLGISAEELRAKLRAP